MAVYYKESVQSVSQLLFSDGIAFSQFGNAGMVRRINNKGEKTDICYNGSNYFGQPSCGLIFINKVFYDINSLEPIIDMNEYDLFENTDQLTFSDDGTLFFLFKNPAGHVYHATIDTNGNFIEEPAKGRE